MDRNEKSRHQACSAPTSGAEETHAGDSELAQNIWGRYGHSPGVIPTAVTLGLARRITRLSTNRIPLLADIQRRWTADDVSFPGGWSALPYARPIAFPDTLSVSADTASPASAARVRNFGYPGPVPLSGPLTGLQRIVSALPTKEQNSVNRPVVEKVKRLSIHSSISQGEEAPKLQASATEVQDAPNRGVLEKSPMAGMENHSTEAKNSTCPVIGQNAEPLTFLSKDTLKENHSTEAKNSAYPVTGQNAEPSTFLSKDTLKLKPAVQKTRHGSDVVEIQTGVSIMTSANNLGTAITQRFMDGPAGRVARRTSEFFGEAAPTISLGREIPMQQPATGKIQYGSDVQDTQTKMPITTTSSSPGVAILRRYPDGQAGPQRISGMTDQGRFESHRTFNILQHVEKIGIPLFRSALTGTSAFINARPLMGPSSERPPEMPFVKADGLNSMKIEAQSNSFSSPIAMPLQRGVADASSNILANEVLSTVSTQDVNEPSLLSMVESDTKNLDLERLANEVYAIIEQRITIERENFGI